MLASSQEQYNLLLVGRTGNGKSSIGNALLDQQHAFKTGNRDPDDVIEFASAFIDGLRVQVIDGTGIGDMGEDAKNDIPSLIAHISETLWRYVLNVNAIVLVLKYGIRYTKQEKDAVELVKSIFGQDVLKKWGVIVMTHGDNFERDNENDNVAFEDWLKEQTGHFQTLVAECDNRCVLFNNKEKGELKRRAQRDKLIDKIKTIQHRPYSYLEFQEATHEHDKIIVASKISNLHSRAMVIVNKINQEIVEIQKESRFKTGNIKKLQSMSNELGSLKLLLNQEDRDTGLVKPILVQVSVTELSLETCRKWLEDLDKRRDFPSQSRVASEHSVTLGPAEEYYMTRRLSTRPWFVTWSTIECMAVLGVVVTVISIVTLVFASRYADF